MSTMRAVTTRSLALALLLAPAVVHADAKSDRATKSLHAAIAKGDAAVKPLIANYPVAVRGIGLTEACEPISRARFVNEPDLPAFVECLQSLKLTVRGSVFVVEPGIEIIPVLEGSKLVSLFSDGQLKAEHAAKNLAATANIPPTPEGKAAIEKKETPFLAASISLCVGADGTVEVATVDRYTPVAAGAWADAIVEKTRATTYAPFKRQGTAIRACTSQLHVYPASKRKAGIAALDALAPNEEGGEEGGVVGGVGGDIVQPMRIERVEPGDIPPPAPPQNVPPTLLEGSRIAGTKAIVPDDDTKIAIAKAGKDKLVGSYKLCINATGALTVVQMLKSTGFTAYDDKIMREMRQWRYRPYAVNGRAVPVCTAVTFIYSQK